MTPALLENARVQMRKYGIVESGDAVGNGVARRYYQNGNVVFCSAQGSQYAEAIAVRQAKIEQSQVMIPLHQCVLGLDAVTNPVDRETATFEPVHHGPAYHWIVFNDQCSHISFLCIVCDRVFASAHVNEWLLIVYRDAA